MVSDDVKLLYKQLHEFLSRSALDSRNGVMRVIDFYDKVTGVFNDESFVPDTENLPDLYEFFAESKKLPLGKYVMTRDKAKYLVVSVRPKLAKMVHKYELSGNGAGQRSEDDADYGRVDLENCVDGDDTANFIESGSGLTEVYLLYWWHKLDAEDFI